MLDREEISIEQITTQLFPLYVACKPKGTALLILSVGNKLLDISLEYEGILNIVKFLLLSCLERCFFDDMFLSSLTILTCIVELEDESINTKIREQMENNNLLTLFLAAVFQRHRIVDQENIYLNLSDILALIGNFLGVLYAEKTEHQRLISVLLPQSIKASRIYVWQNDVIQARIDLSCLFSKICPDEAENLLELLTF